MAYVVATIRLVLTGLVMETPRLVCEWSRLDADGTVTTCDEDIREGDLFELVMKSSIVTDETQRQMWCLNHKDERSE